MIYSSIVVFFIPTTGLEARSMKRAAALIIVLAITVSAGILCAETSFRCGSDLIELGYTMYQVKGSCGAPDSEQVIGAKEISKVRPGVREKGETELNITEWIYERDSGIYVLTFEGDRLVRKQFRNN
jgi:hypothetical protein